MAEPSNVRGTAYRRLLSPWVIVKTEAKYPAKKAQEGEHGERSSGQPSNRAPAEDKTITIMAIQRSRASFRRPQCLSLRSGLNARSTWRFRASRTPMRANIVGPPDVATRQNRVKLGTAGLFKGCLRSKRVTSIAPARPRPQLPRCSLHVRRLSQRWATRCLSRRPCKWVC